MRKLLLIFMLSILLIAGCAQQQEPVKPVAPEPAKPTPVMQKEVLKFGAVLPLTGSLANLGEGMRDAMVLAVEDINKAGGVNGKELKLIVEDTGCDPAKAVPAVNKLVSVDRVVAIAGPTCSGESFATSSILNENKIPAVSPSATNAKLSTDGGAYWFRVSASDSFQGKAGATYARETLKKQRAALLYQNDDWGVGLRDVFKANFKELGGQVVIEESFEKDTTDMRTQVAKIKSFQPDIIYMPCFPKECVIAFKQLAELGVTAQKLGADGAEDPQALAEVSEQATGFIITAPSGAASAEFGIRFKDRFGKDPGAFAAQSYDAVHVLAAAAQNGPTGEGIKAGLGSLDYKGVIGPIQFDANGDVKTATFDLKKFEGGTFTVIEKIKAE